jgi:DNA-binding MarR family transcriptional regulator
MSIALETQTAIPALKGKSKPKEKRRLNLDLTPEAYELLQKLANESGKNMAEVLRTGLLLYGISQEEAKNGRSLAVAEGERVITRIVTT